jgi:hypothetical protein
MRSTSELSVVQPDGTTCDITASGPNPFDDAGVQFRFELPDRMPAMLVTVTVDDEKRLWRHLAAIPQVREQVAPRCAVMGCGETGTVSRVYDRHWVVVCGRHDLLTDLGRFLAGEVSTRDRQSLLRDEDCPSCGWPETYAEVDFAADTPGAEAFGCRKCGWRVEAGEVSP